jgi:hypothetical protein
VLVRGVRMRPTRSTATHVCEVCTHDGRPIPSTAVLLEFNAVSMFVERHMAGS